MVGFGACENGEVRVAQRWNRLDLCAEKYRCTFRVCASLSGKRERRSRMVRGVVGMVLCFFRLNAMSCVGDGDEDKYRMILIRAEQKASDK